MSVYSVRLATNIVSAGPVLVYTVPAGIAAVVRDVLATQVSASSGAFSIFLTVAGGASNLRLWTWGSIPDFGNVHWEGRQVLEPGDTLSVITDGSTWHYSISGYQLSLP